ncbi:MAG TPA: hypothetical protein VF989_05740 [Polyangiaceae bacterium]
MSGEEGRLGSFDDAGVLGRVKAKPRADARSLADSRALTQPARASADLWVLEQ